MRFRLKYLIAWGMISAAFLTCERYEIDRDPGLRLGFSTDTLFFDTVFTTIGTTTRNFRIYNDHHRSLEISRIELAGGRNSVFRLNVDGVASPTHEHVKIPPKDSLFIFVEATLNPNNRDSLLAIHDSVVFETNGNIQDVNLVAWGQDVHLFRREFIGTSTWTADKPYLILDYLVLDTLETLTIREGVQVYLHRDAWLIIKGTMEARGSLEHPIVFQGDRLEQLYRDIPGQWERIYFWPGSRDNILEHVHIRNGTIGLHADTLINPDLPNLRIRNCRIENMSAIGILGRGTSIHASNLAIGACGQLSVFLWIGGHYEFYHTTIGNYWSAFSNRTTPAVAIQDYYEDVNNNINSRPFEKVYFGNTIIYGNKDEELVIDLTDENTPWLFEHCLVRADPSAIDLADTNHFLQVLNQTDPLFIDPEVNNLQLDTLSPAKDIALPSLSAQFPLDLLGNPRTGGRGPDLGAYERYENDTVYK